MSVFDKIAPIYGMFFDFQVKYFSRIIEKVKKEDFDITKYKNVLDVGCGTGALLKVLHCEGLEVKGVDASPRMLAQAKKRLKDLPIDLIQVIPGERLPFSDKSFDVVITSYVVHGLKPDERIKLYKEMKRLAKEVVVIYDYNENRALLTTIIEWLEGGDYFNFIKVVERELSKIFDDVRKINVDTRAAWYICDVKTHKRWINIYLL